MTKLTNEAAIKQAIRQNLEDLDNRSALSTVWEFIRDMLGVFTLSGRGIKLVVASEVEIAKATYVAKRIDSLDADTNQPAPRKWFD